MMMQSLLRASISEVHQLFRRREVSPVEVLEQTLRLLETLEPKLNAFITVMAESAHQQAREAEEVFRRADDATLLTGVPVSVKDLIAIESFPMTAGSRILRGYRPQVDADVVTRLRRAGAVVFGKTNLLEFAYGFVHPDYGQANNPWDFGRTAGGSSSGSAASVAAGIGYSSVVTDTGGSARLPAAFCGLVGLRPTTGTIDTSGILPLAPTLDTVGVVARTAADTRVMWEVLANAPTGGSTPISLSGIRVGVVDELLGAPLDSEVLANFEAALDTLRSAGATVHRLRLPEILALAEQSTTIMLAEAAYSHRRWYPHQSADYAPGTRANLDTGTRTSAVDYLRALAARTRLTDIVDTTFETVDVLACPTIGFTAPEREPDFADGGFDYIQRTFPFAVTGHPALSVPAGLTSGNLPVGLQLIAPRNREQALVDYAACYERECGGFPHAPISG
ncbi:aspartyl-tRNA(Asn)/glutamyl-tRNA(Gln) amidotransferase subunit A [Nocardia sp. GAS34]|uniref:amidase n=1 Tax=unclassified Nocardia TaxID=2637762 RepID=UPI003D1BB8E3